LSLDKRWIDVHTHLEMLEGTPEDVIAQAALEGVYRFITIGTHPDENKKVLQIASRYFPTVACTLGIHPHEAVHLTDQVFEDIEKRLNDPWVVGIGEIGLDYYYNHSPHDIQRAAFRRQMELAAKHKLPIQIHTRDAEDDTIEILNEFKGRVTGLFHCFTGTKRLAEAGLALGYNISFSGIITFKSAEDLRNVVKMVPIERMHVETDAPFLAPIPMRGKKNTPAFIVHTAKKIAELKSIPEERLSEQLIKNATHLFKKLQ
jgi:TatD DNase family protein